MGQRVLLLLVLFMLTAEFSSGSSPLKFWLKQLEKEGYDKDVPPALKVSGTTTKVDVGFYVESIGNFRVKSMDYSLDIYFREQWTDARLKHNKTECFQSNDLDTIKRIWQPDTYFANSKRAFYNDVTVPNLMVWICRDGNIRFSARLSITLSCNMDLKAYPLDWQVCHMKMLSYGNVQERLNLTWENPNPIHFNPKILASDLRMTEHEADYCNGTYFDGTIYSCLIARFHLKRAVGQSVLQMYLPSLCIVIISWISFWVDPNSVPGRVGLAVTTLLTLSTQAVGIAYQLPPVGYAKAVDVWLGVCLMFLFGALIEFTVVNMFMRRWISITNKDKSGIKVLPLLTLSDDDFEKAKENLASFYRKKALKIDQYSRALFPITFCVFMIIYWTVYAVM